MPAVLQQLMRHEDIQTTLKYYVGQDAEAMAQKLWASHVGTLVDTTTASETSVSENPLKTSGDDRS